MPAMHCPSKQSTPAQSSHGPGSQSHVSGSTGTSPGSSSSATRHGFSSRALLGTGTVQGLPHGRASTQSAVVVHSGGGTGGTQRSGQPASQVHPGAPMRASHSASVAHGSTAGHAGVHAKPPAQKSSSTQLRGQHGSEGQSAGEKQVLSTCTHSRTPSPSGSAGVVQ